MTGQRSPWITAFGLVLAAVAAIELGALVVAGWRFTTDDAWITLRYARHLAAGEGLRWNPGEPPVEGYSNFSYVVIGAAALASGIDPIVALKSLGLAALVATLALVGWITAREAGEPLAGLAAVLSYLGYWGVAFWAVSGLETPFYSALALGAVALAGWGARRRAEGRDARALLAAAGGAVLVAAWTRPEGPLVGLAIAIGAVVSVRQGEPGRARRDGESPGRAGVAVVLPIALSAGLPYVAYSIWKLWFFGDLVPNSVRCKMLYAGDPWVLLRGAFLLVVWTLPLAGYAVVRRRTLVRVALAALAALSLAILYGTDPIIGHGNRHALTAFAALVVLATVGAWDIVSRLPVALATPWRSSLLVALVAVFGLGGAGGRVGHLRGIADGYAGRERVRRELGHWLNAQLTPRDRVLTADCGVIAYETRARIVDALCLNQLETPRPPIERDPVAFARWVFERPPEAVILNSLRADRFVPRPENDVARQLALRPELAASYRLALVSGSPGDNFHYFVFLRDRGGREGIAPVEDREVESVQ